jgi:hypothetical protein
MWRVIILIAAFSVPQLLHAQTNVQTEQLPEQTMGARIKSFRGETFRLRTRANRRTVVLLWASWCPSCLVALWDLQSAQAELSNQHIRLIGLTFENPPQDRSLARRRSQNVRYRLGFIDFQTLKTLAGDHTPVPQVLIISGDGRVLVRLKGFARESAVTQLRAALKT